MRYPDGCILVFAKAPIPGLVKTRLQPLLGPESCAQLQQRLIVHTLQTACSRELSPVQLWCSPSTQETFFRTCRTRFNLPLRRQIGIDLGSRMHNALHHALRQRRYGVIIGTDCPFLDTKYLAQALAILDRGKDAVIGPAQDGGYVLLGVRHPIEALFTGISWGSDQVYKQTLQRFGEVGWDYEVLKVLTDVDTPQDLASSNRHPLIRQVMHELIAGPKLNGANGKCCE